jgi:hypothetical protein
MKEELNSSETSVLRGATRRNSPEDAILHSHRSENLKSYIILRFNCIYLCKSHCRLYPLDSVSEIYAEKIYKHLRIF